MAQKRCEICNIEFEQRGKTCSDICSKKHKKKYQRKYHKNYYHVPDVKRKQDEYESKPQIKQLRKQRKIKRLQEKSQIILVEAV